MAKKKLVPGKCPKCGSKDLDYECSNSLDDYRIYPATCLKCGAEFKEIYREVLVEVEVEE